MLEIVSVVEVGGRDAQSAFFCVNKINSGAPLPSAPGLSLHSQETRLHHYHYLVTYSLLSGCLQNIYHQAALSCS